ncbi:MAG: CHAD domain-containing protein, partial [Microcoleaceae cyanobacterium]
PQVLLDKDPEELHQMRVGMRRLRSAIAGFAPVLIFPKTVDDQSVGKVARCLGAVRDLDVLQACLIEDYRPILPSDEQHNLDLALFALNKQRSEAFQKIEKMFNSKLYQRLIQGLTNWLEAPQYQAIASLPIGEVLPDLLLPEVSHLFLHQGWLVRYQPVDNSSNILPINEQDSLAEIITTGEVNQLDLSTDQSVREDLDLSKDLTEDLTDSYLASDEEEILHDLRKQVKRTRYQMSLFTELYGEQYAQYLKDLGSMQDYLGELQDIVVLTEFMKKNVHKKLNKTMPYFVAELEKKRFKVWRKWQVLQSRYLQIDVRKALRLELLQPLV